MGQLDSNVQSHTAALALSSSARPPELVCANSVSFFKFPAAAT
jgi:hypothetical protein